MILAPLIGLSLVVTVAVDTVVPTSPMRSAGAMTAQQKSTIMQPLVRSATECITRTVAADPRIRDSIKASDIRDLIVDSMPSCADAMRAMIDVHEQLYGEGSGESFFSGPYLDTLPAAVFSSVKDIVQ